MIPKPNLDDRTHKQIVEEAIRLIPKYCPQWTNHNPTDPGITLIELFSWMMEMVIYRLNKVPEKTYLTLLELMGVNLSPPQPAKTLVTFQLAEGANHGQLINKGTQVATTQTGDNKAIVFETEKDLHVLNCKLVKCISMDRDKIADNSHFVGVNEGKKRGFSVFQGKSQIDRFIYIGDDSLINLADSNVLHLLLRNSLPLEEKLHSMLEWEYWNDKHWINITPELKEDEIVFKGPFTGINKCKVDEVESIWLRGKLMEIPQDKKQTLIETVETKILIGGEGVVPDICYSNNANLIYTPVDLSKDFYPFVGEPKYNDAFYMAGGDVFSKEGATIEVKIKLQETSVVEQPQASEELTLSWEYWNGKQWKEIGLTSGEGVKKEKGIFSFVDETNAFTQTGVVKFKHPPNLKKCEVNGQENFWLRVRINTGDFGVGGRYVQDSLGHWVWSFDRPLRPPLLESINLKYNIKPCAPKHCFTFNDYRFKNHSEMIRNNLVDFMQNNKVKSWQPFEVVKDLNPACYFGFDKGFPQENIQIYFVMEGEGVLSNFLTDKDSRDKKIGASLIWEYWNGEIWDNLVVNDYTRSFFQSGVVEFRGPRDFKIRKEFGKELYWLRVRLEMGSFTRVPEIKNILLNSVVSLSSTTIKNEILGSSDGMPEQSFTFLRGPVLFKPQIWLREKEMPMEQERKIIFEEEGQDAFYKEEATEEGGFWVRWHQVENFFESGSGSRHYLVDYVNNKIVFGDGTTGLIPPEGRNNIKAASYQIGGGTEGNVAAGNITVIKGTIPFISGVINYYPAEGGADMETVEEAKIRAPHIFKNRYRAVTADDYEWIAKEASSHVARAHCIPTKEKEGEVTVVIVSKEDRNDGKSNGKLVPTRELLRRVREHLDERRLITTMLKVIAPKYVDISVKINVVLKSTVTEIQATKKEIEKRLRTFLHPLNGGPDKKGWPFGMPLGKSDIHNVVEKVENIYYISDIEIKDENKGVVVDKAILGEECLFHPTFIEIVERVSEF